MDKRMKRRLSLPRRAALGACLGAMALSLLATVWYLGDYGGVIPPRVTVSGYPVGGLTAEEAREQLERALGERWGEGQVSLCQGDRLILALQRRELGAAPDFAAAAEQAAALGSGGSLWDRFRRGLSRLWGGPRADLAPPVSIDPETLAAAVPLQPRDAWYDEASEQIAEGHVGLSFQIPDLERALAAAPPEGGLRFQVEVLQPRVDAADLKECLFRDVLSTYVTQVGGSAARQENVARSAAAINGTVLQNGETFDFDETVGERTEAAGYGPAPSYLEGALVETVGGGVCQTAGTLYAATLYAGLEIRSRSAHTYAVSYLPLGLDAAVSWGGPALRFQNSTGYPLKLETWVAEGELTVRLVGTRTEDLTVEIETEVLEETPYTTRTEETADLCRGERQVAQAGQNGYTVRTWRVLRRPDGTQLSRREVAVSRYRSREEVVMLGTGR